MVGEYATAAAVLRRPMRRWWRRTGAAWIVFTLCLLALQAGWLTYGRLRTMQPLAEIAWQSVEWLVPVAAMLLWVLAAAKVLSVLDSMTAAVPIPRDTAQQGWLRFSCCLHQGIWPTVLVCCSKVLLNFENQLPAVSGNFRRLSLIGALSASAEAMPLVVSVLCVLVLLSLPSVPRSLVWFWFICSLVVPRLYIMFLLSSMRMAAVNTGWSDRHPPGLHTDYAYTQTTEALFSLAATALFLVIVRLFLADRIRSALPLAWAYAALVLLTNANIGTRVFLIDWILVSITKLAIPFIFLATSSLRLDEAGTLNIYVLSWVVELHGDAWLASLRIAAAALNLLICYLLVRAVLLWPIPKPAAPAATAVAA